MFQINPFLSGIILFLLFSSYVNAQEVNNSEEYRHGIGVLVTHSYISQGKIDGKRKFIAAPSFGVNYNYYINEKWAVGFHNDIIIESFIVESTAENNETLEREFPISNLIIGSYKLKESLALTFGTGIEWERNENFGIIRVGVDYALELNEKGLEMIFVFNYDNIINAYAGVNFGIGLNKLF